MLEAARQAVRSHTDKHYLDSGMNHYCIVLFNLLNNALLKLY